MRCRLSGAFPMECRDAIDPEFIFLFVPEDHPAERPFIFVVDSVIEHVVWQRIDCMQYAAIKFAQEIAAVRFYMLCAYDFRAILDSRHILPCSVPIWFFIFRCACDLCENIMRK